MIPAYTEHVKQLAFLDWATTQFLEFALIWTILGKVVCSGDFSVPISVLQVHCSFRLQAGIRYEHSGNQNQDIWRSFKS